MIEEFPPDPCAQGCPSRELLDLIGDKWSLLVMLVVGQGVTRNGAIKRRIQGISQKMLTQTLRALELNGLVERHDFATVPPHVEYELTVLGRSLSTAMGGLHVWVSDNFAAVQAARARYRRNDADNQLNGPLRGRSVATT